MAWRAVIPGQPPSVNHSYTYHHGRVSKTSAVTAYQTAVVLIIRTTKPANWKPSGQIKIRYWLRLGHTIDADNALKALNDAIAHALDVNDDLFLPCVVEKSTGNSHPEVEVEIDG